MRIQILTEQKIHTVSKGENLTSIAKKYGVPWKNIANINNVEGPKYIIRPGQKLEIPVGDGGGGQHRPVPEEENVLEAFLEHIGLLTLKNKSVLDFVKGKAVSWHKESEISKLVKRARLKRDISNEESALEARRLAEVKLNNKLGPHWRSFFNKNTESRMVGFVKLGFPKEGEEFRNALANIVRGLAMIMARLIFRNPEDDLKIPSPAAMKELMKDQFNLLNPMIDIVMNGDIGSICNKIARQTFMEAKAKLNRGVTFSDLKPTSGDLKDDPKGDSYIKQLVRSLEKMDESQKIFENYFKQNKTIIEQEQDSAKEKLTTMVTDAVNDILNALPDEDPAKNRETGLKIMDAIKKELQNPERLKSVVDDIADDIASQV